MFLATQHMNDNQVILFCRGDLHCIDGLKMHIQKQTLWSIVVDGKKQHVTLVKIVSSLRQFDKMNNKEGSDQNIWGASFSIESFHRSPNILGQLPKIYFQDDIDLCDIKY